MDQQKDDMIRPDGSQDKKANNRKERKRAETHLAVELKGKNKTKPAFL